MIFSAHAFVFKARVKVLRMSLHILIEASNCVLNLREQLGVDGTVGGDVLG